MACVCGSCEGKASGGAAAELLLNIPDSTCDDANNTRFSGAAPDFASRKPFSSPRSNATSSARVCTCSSSVFIRASCAGATKLSALEDADDTSCCAREVEHKNKIAYTITAFFMTLPLKMISRDEVPRSVDAVECGGRA